MIARFAKLLATVWRRTTPHCEPPPPQCADPSPQCGPAWADYLPDHDRSPQGLAEAFALWARDEPEFVGRSLNSQYVKDLYLEAARQGWPPYRDFARELGRIMPRKRVWPEGQSLTVYRVEPPEVVQPACKRA
jgi:hypothetical protein